MKKLLYMIILCAACTVFYACEEHQENKTTDHAPTASSDTISKETPASTDTGDTLVSGTLKVYPLTDSPSFNDAILDLNAPLEHASLDKGKVHFSYDIKNYQLSKPTLEGSCAMDCANSGQGQHIHLILNNEPYLARYTTEFDETLAPGRYVALSFLSRSYHESIKHYEAFDLRQFTVGKEGEKIKAYDLTQPMLFYSRPKGEYKGKETKKILLDFYVVNATLSAQEYSVRATINDQVFTLTSWKAYILEGLPMGSNTIKIELLDKGHPVQGPYTATERKITLLEH